MRSKGEMMQGGFDDSFDAALLYYMLKDDSESEKDLIVDQTLSYVS